MTARDFCPAPPMDPGTHPIDFELPVFVHVKKFPGLFPASNETTGVALTDWPGGAAGAPPNVPHPTSILNIANKSCRIFIGPSFRGFKCFISIDAWRSRVSALGGREAPTSSRTWHEEGYDNETSTDLRLPGSTPDRSPCDRPRR